MSAQEKRPISAEDLYQFQLVSDPQISPDGRYVVFGLTRIDAKSQKKYTNLWVVPTDGSEPPHQFTYGDHTDATPRWSPNGRFIAFLSNRKDEKQAQLHIIPLNGGEARPLTSFKGSIASYQWSPDGTKFVCQFRQKDQEAIEREEDEQKKKLGVVARHITRVYYKLDGAGYLPKEHWHIWTVDAATGEATQLTAGDTYDETEPCWSPDGQHILFVSNRAPDPDFAEDETELYLIPATGGQMQQIAAHHGRKSAPVFSPDGTHIAYIGRVLAGKWYQNANLFVVPASGGTAHNLTAHLDKHLSIVTLTDMGTSTAQTLPTWSADSQTIYCQTSDYGDQPVMAFKLDGTAEFFIHAPGQVGSFSLDASQNQVAYLWGQLDNVGQVRVWDRATGETRQLTQFNEGLLAQIDLGRTEEVWFNSPDGTKLHGWITFPPGFDAAQKYPSIMEIHGGPQTQYGRVFMHEFYYLAAQGYVVYWSNPRGSQGYGETFAGAIYNQWGTVDYDDVMAWADYMTQQPYIDPSRMGVTGGSYGGYMTSLIIGRTHRFKAAVAQRVVSNLISFYGSCDFNWGAEYLMGMEKAPWDDLQNYWRQSPISYVGGAKTPTLFIHSEMDQRCDREQGEQMYVALKRLGVETELVLFPEESHGLSRIGRTDRRIARLNHILGWFERHLK